MESVEPVSVTHVQAHCYEPQTIALQVSNPFEDATHNSADGRFTLRLTQAILSEHAAVAGLTAGGRRASMNMVGGTHRRRSSAQTSLVTSKDAGSAVEGGGRRAGETGGAKNKHQDGVGAGHGSDDVKVCRRFRFRSILDSGPASGRGERRVRSSTQSLLKNRIYVRYCVYQLIASTQ